MSLSAQDIVALARAGYNAEQISLLNRESSTPSTEVSTPSTPSTPSTESTTEVSTPSAPSAPQEAPAQPETPSPAPAPQDPAPAAPDPAPTMKDIMAELAALKNSLHTAAINRDQQPGQEDRLTGEQVLANIIDPRQK